MSLFQTLQNGDMLDPFQIRASNAAVGSVLCINADGLPAWDATGAFPVTALIPGAANQALVTNAGATAAEWSDNLALPGTLAVTGITTLTGKVGVGGSPVAAVAKFTIGGSFAATLGFAYSAQLVNTLVAAANLDELLALHVNVSRTPGAFTGLVAGGIHLSAFSVAGFTSPADPFGFAVDAITGTGATNAFAYRAAPPTGATNNYLFAHTTPATFSIGATGAVRTASSVLSTSPTAGIGYSTGAGGAQTQETDKATTVVSNTITTAITMNAAELAAATAVSFTFTNSTIAATDTVIVTHQSAGTSGAYTCNAFPGAGSAVVTIRNNTAGALSEAIVLRVTVLKSVSA